MHLDYIFDTLAYPTSWAIPDDSSAMNFLRCLDNFERTVPFAQRAQYPMVFSEKEFLVPIKILNFLIRLSDNIIFAGLPFSHLKKSIWAPNCPLHCSLTAKQHPGTLVPGLLFREGIGAAGQHLPRCFPSARLRSVWANINKQ